MCCACWYDLDPIQSEGHRASEVPKIALFKVCLRQYDVQLQILADFWISLPVGGHVISKFAKCWYHHNPVALISMLLEACDCESNHETKHETWRACWHNLDSVEDRGQGQGSHELGKTASIPQNRSLPFGRGSDDRQPPSVAILYKLDALPATQPTASMLWRPHLSTSTGNWHNTVMDVTGREMTHYHDSNWDYRRARS